MGSLLDQLQKKSRVLIHISNPQIQQHQFAKMASFKILLVVALVAFIGSTDALKCQKLGGTEETCVTPNDKSCAIEAKIKITAGAGAIVEPLTKQGCNAKVVEGTKKFVVPEELHDLKEGAVVPLPYYCNTDNCNTKKAINDEIEKKEKMAALLKDNPKNPKMDIAGPNIAGAAQTSVAVATIAFSMVMARL